MVRVVRFRPRRGGWSLAEVLFALTLLGAGLLTAAAGAGQALELATDAGRARRGAALAERRLELLRAAGREGCAGLGDGSSPAPGGLTERWRVEPWSPGQRRVRVALERPTPGGLRRDSLTGLVPCRP